MKVKDISDFPVHGVSKLYVNENLTQGHKRLFCWLSKKQKNSITSLSGFQTTKLSFMKAKKQTV